jgi:hypothetical protein
MRLFIPWFVERYFWLRREGSRNKCYLLPRKDRARLAGYAEDEISMGERIIGTIRRCVVGDVLSSVDGQEPTPSVVTV